LDFDEKRQFCACSLDVDILTVGEADAGQRRQDGKNTFNVTAGNKKIGGVLSRPSLIKRHFLRRLYLLIIFDMIFFQGCQIYAGTTDQKWKNILTNGHKIYQMTIKYPKGQQMFKKITKLFHCKALQNLPKLGFLV
jgi:hypothetical protein